MPIFMALLVYDIDESCIELAKRTGWHKKYSRQRMHELIKAYTPSAYRRGNHYLLTDAELDWIATSLQTNKRRK
jgi:hypothetical protein